MCAHFAVLARGGGVGHGVEFQAFDGGLMVLLLEATQLAGEV